MPQDKEKTKSRLPGQNPETVSNHAQEPEALAAAAAVPAPKGQKSCTFVENISLERYDAFVHSQPDCNLLQSAPWPRVKSEWKALRVGLEVADGQLVAGAQILCRPLAFGYSFGYLAHGPLLDYREPGLLESFLKEPRGLARRQHCLLLRVHPPCRIHEGHIEDFRSGQEKTVIPEKELIARFATAGFTLQPRSRRMADTIQPRFEAVILKDSRQEPPRAKIKYNLKLCERHKVSLRCGGREDLDEFSRLIRMTEARQGVRLRDKAYFERLFDAFGENASLYFADIDLAAAQAHAAQREKDLLDELADAQAGRSGKKEKQVQEKLLSVRKDLSFYAELMKEPSDTHTAAAILVLRYGKTAEMPYAGSDEHYARLPAVWALYVQGIRDAFAVGCERYNLGGLEGSLDDGLTSFKAHFDPLIEETCGEFDYSGHPLLCGLFKRALALYKKLRR